MIHLCLSRAGTGKTYWLEQQRANILIDCTHKSHRSILAAIATAATLDFPARASIDDLVQLITAAPITTIALDNIDRTSPKLCYSLLTIAEKHTIYATATDRKRILVLLERNAAILLQPPAANIRAILAAHYPNLTSETVRHIASIAKTPAAALNLARAASAGTQPAPAPTSIMPLIAIATLSIITLIIRQHLNDAALAAAAIAAASLIRRKLWYNRT